MFDHKLTNKPADDTLYFDPDSTKTSIRRTSAPPCSFDGGYRRAQDEGAGASDDAVRYFGGGREQNQRMHCNIHSNEYPGMRQSAEQTTYVTRENGKRDAKEKRLEHGTETLSLVHCIASG